MQLGRVMRRFVSACGWAFALAAVSCGGGGGGGGGGGAVLPVLPAAPARLPSPRPHRRSPHQRPRRCHRARGAW
jgi:hypothetical protein